MHDCVIHVNGSIINSMFWQITINGDNGQVFESQYQEDFGDDISEEAKDTFVDAFLAYSPNGMKLTLGT